MRAQQRRAPSSAPQPTSAHVVCPTAAALPHCPPLTHIRSFCHPSRRLTFQAQTDGKIFRIAGSDILEFLDNNPGAFIWMRDTLLVE